MPGNPPMPFQRLFIAIAVPPAVRREIGRALGKMRRNAPPGAVRWTRTEQFHVTIKFLGDVPASQVPAVEQSVSEVCAGFPAIHLSAHGVGFFPGEQKPRVVWAGVDDDNGQLARLHRLLEDALRFVAPAEKPEKFAGHITLGRFKPGHHSAIEQLREIAGELRGRHFGGWQAETVELVRSELASDGAVHTPVRSFPLVIANLPPAPLSAVRKN